MVTQTATHRQLRGCNLCGETAARELYTARDRLSNSGQPFSIASCCGCGVLRTLPEMSDAELADSYPADYWGSATEPSLEWVIKSQAEKTRFLARCGLSGGRILDVGCGSGLFLRSLDSKVWQRFGVETGKAAVNAARSTLRGIRVVQSSLIDADLDESSLDVVTFWSALEHMNDPRENLAKARRLLRSGGSVIVQVPNAGSYQFRMFKGDWFALDAPRHRYHFTLEALERVLTDTGFAPYQVTFFSEAHNSHALRQSLKTRLVANATWPISRVLFYLAVPLIKPADLMMTLAGLGATITLAARAQ